jgi:hypothetical protein
MQFGPDGGGGGGGVFVRLGEAGFAVFEAMVKCITCEVVALVVLEVDGAVEAEAAVSHNPSRFQP